MIDESEEYKIWSEVLKDASIEQIQHFKEEVSYLMNDEPFIKDFKKENIVKIISILDKIIKERC